MKSFNDLNSKDVPTLLYVDDRPCSLSEHLLKRSDVSLVLLRFKGNPLPSEYITETEHLPSFYLDRNIDIVDEVERFRSWSSARNVLPQYFLNPSEPAQYITQTFARALGLPALSDEQVLMVRNKIIMKSKLAEIGIAAAKFTPISSKEELLRFGDAVGWPVILKPVDGFATINTFKLSRVQAVSHVIKESCKWMAEELQLGREYECCALIQNQKVLSTFISYMPESPIEIVEGGMNANITLRDAEVRQLPADLHEVVQNIVSGFQLDHGYLHMEFFLSSDGMITFGEVGLRLAGCEIPRNHALAYGFDIFEVLTDIHLHRTVHIKFSKDLCAGDLMLPTATGYVTNITSQKDLECLPGVVNVKMKVTEGNYITKVRASHSSSGVVHVVGGSVSEVESRMREIMKCFVIKTNENVRCRRMKIAFVATSFGFGPVAKAVYIAKQLKSIIGESGELCYFGSGIAFDYVLRESAFENIVDVDVDRDIVRTCELLEGHDLVVNVMNFALLPLWCSELKMVIIDSLAWMWQCAPLGIENVMHYFVQDYLVSEDQLEDLKGKVGVSLVAPITESKYIVRQKANRLLVNFSGAGNPFVAEEFFKRYVLILGELILEQSIGRFEEIVFACNNRLIEYLQDHLITSDIVVRMNHFDHDAFIDELCTARKVLTTAGITTTLEAIVHKVDVGFLVPQNYSQALMSECYFNKRGFEKVMALSRFGAEFVVDENLDEDAGVAHVSFCVGRILEEKKADLRSFIHRFLEDGKQILLSDLIKFDDFEPGQNQIARYIVEDLYGSD